MWTTTDGGETWRPVPGESKFGWRTADFIAPDIGILAGRFGSLSLVGDGQLLPPLLDQQGIRAIHAIAIDRQMNGWVVGDGALALKSENGGITWDAISTFPRETSDVCDFHAVAHRGNHVWIGGSPGSVIWYSGNGGRSWETQPTGQSQSIRRLRFLSDTEGWAVGSMGLILRTTDAGRTWQAVRGGGRHAALLLITGRPQQAPFELLAKLSADQGLRSVVLVPSRWDIGANESTHREQSDQLREAVCLVGGNETEFGWRLPVALPGVDRSRDRLLDEWNKRTEGRLADILVGRLVCALRTWRPAIVVVDRSNQNDALAGLIEDALTVAVKDAARSDRFVEHGRYWHLSPHTTAKLYRRLPDGSEGSFTTPTETKHTVTVDALEALTRLNTTTQALAGRARGVVGQRRAPSELKQTYESINQAHAGGFLAGIVIQPGTANRRRLLELPVFDDRLAKAVQKQKHFQAFVRNYADDPQKAVHALSELEDVLAGISDADAAELLLQLAENHQTRSRWDLAEATWIELITRYPEEPATLRAMQQLFAMWTSAELNWQRLRAANTGQLRSRVNSDKVSQAFDAAEPIQNRVVPVSAQDAAALHTLATNQGLHIAHAGSTSSGDWQNQMLNTWLSQGAKMAKVLQARSPIAFESPEVQFTLAALLRRRQSYEMSEQFYRKFSASTTSGEWKAVAERELWLINQGTAAPQAVHLCKRITGPPQLDGVLSDACWQDAMEIPLQDHGDKLFAEHAPTNAGHGSIAMLAHDGQFLYLAASIRRHDGAPRDSPSYDERQHDADLRDFDRIGFFFDIDRDYAGHYTFQIDQRGWTHDACAGDRGWNTKRWVAAQADETHWRIEVAIPLESLSPTPPTPQTVWAMGVTRVIPTFGAASWTGPTTAEPQPRAFGLLRFE
ncbi:MAG: YCF48-related protein [Planctomycetota bacterium]|nr:YCF48-related protein [Planctomycetota bacterium]